MIYGTECIAGVASYSEFGAVILHYNIHEKRWHLQAQHKHNNFYFIHVCQYRYIIKCG